MPKGGFASLDHFKQNKRNPLLDFLRFIISIILSATNHKFRLNIQPAGNQFLHDFICPAVYALDACINKVA